MKSGGPRCRQSRRRVRVGRASVRAGPSRRPVGWLRQHTAGWRITSINAFRELGTGRVLTRMQRELNPFEFSDGTDVAFDATREPERRALRSPGPASRSERAPGSDGSRLLARTPEKTRTADSASRFSSKADTQRRLTPCDPMLRRQGARSRTALRSTIAARASRRARVRLAGTSPSAAGVLVRISAWPPRGRESSHG